MNDAAQPPSDDDDLDRYSRVPLTPKELQRPRRDMVDIESMRELAQRYRQGSQLFRGTRLVAAYIVGALGLFTGLMVSLKTLHWWPYK